ncbi:unnamed protein product [Polarella glacialis]|uniref:Altered inheritance of mitochondria protein 24, mitochondrial n=1 Tax=Polarella glacialis TaxID=89957 RepID=A0A813JKN7_POLGL|nr:unnamed protein product [Polarella glacialis]
MAGFAPVRGRSKRHVAQHALLCFLAAACAAAQTPCVTTTSSKTNSTTTIINCEYWILTNVCDTSGQVPSCTSDTFYKTSSTRTSTSSTRTSTTTRTTITRTTTTRTTTSVTSQTTTSETGTTTTQTGTNTSTSTTTSTSSTRTTTRGTTLPIAEPNFTISGQISFPYEGISEMQAKASVRASLADYIPVTPGAIVRLTASPKVVQRRLAGVRGRRLFATWSVGYEIGVPQTQGPVVQSRVENLDGLIAVGRASAFSNGLRDELVSGGAEPASAFFVSSCLTSACWEETQQALEQAVPTTSSSSSSSAAEQPCLVGSICKAEEGFILGGGGVFVAIVGVCIGCFCCRRVRRHRVEKDTFLSVTHVDAGPARELRRLEAARWAFAEEVLGSAADFPRTTIPEVWTGNNVWGEATESAFQQAAMASPTRDYKLDFQTGVFEGQGRDTTGNFQVVGGACDPSTGRILWREESQDGGVVMECEGQMSVKRLKGSRRGEEGWEIIGTCSAFDISCTVALMGTGVLALHTSARATLNAPPQFSAHDEDADDDDADEFMVMDTTSSSPPSRREGKLIGKPSGRSGGR